MIIEFLLNVLVKLYQSINQSINF